MPDKINFRTKVWRESENCKVLASDKHIFCMQSSLLTGLDEQHESKSERKYRKIKHKSSYKTELLQDEKVLEWLIILSPVD